MGLGKTIQVLSLLLVFKREGQGGGSTSRPSLLVAPASLLANWAVEAERFAPGLRILIAHPSAMPASDLRVLDVSRLEGVDLLFPPPGEIKFKCSCPDSAAMCKHVAAVLYGADARLDSQSELLFGLRRVDAKDLVTQAGAALPKARRGPKSSKLLDDSELGNVFGIEMAEITPTSKPVVRRGKDTTAKF